MASFNGVDLGLIFFMNTLANPKATQVNAYAGANGLEVLDQGSRGGTTVCSGVLIASSAPAMAALEQTLRNAQIDGGFYALVDTLNTTWLRVKLIQYAPEGRIENVVGPLGLIYLGRTYSAQFLHVF